MEFLLMENYRIRAVLSFKDFFNMENLIKELLHFMIIESFKEYLTPYQMKYVPFMEY